MWHVWERGEVYAEFWWDDPRERDEIESLYVDERTILKLNFRKGDGRHGLD